MAYLSEKKLLFIHIPKNAGKSVEQALGVVSEKIIIRPKTRSPLNLTAKFFLNKTQNHSTRSRLFGSYDYVLCAQHLTLQEIILLNLIPSAKLRRCIKFAVIRNPFTRAVSTFRHFTKGSCVGDFISFWKEFPHYHGVEHNRVAHMRGQVDYLRDCSGRLAVENLIRFEDLNCDYSMFCKKYGLVNHKLPHIGVIRDFDYRSFYNSEAKGIVSHLFAEDLDTFKYSF